MKLLTAVMVLALVCVSVVMADATKEDLTKQRQGYLDELQRADAQLKQLTSDVANKQNQIQRIAGAIMALDETIKGIEDSAREAVQVNTGGITLENNAEPIKSEK